MTVKLQLRAGTPKCITYPLLRLIVAGVTTWSQSFPFIGDQTSSKCEAAKCRGAGDLRGGPWERAMNRWLSILRPSLSFGATSYRERGKTC